LRIALGDSCESSIVGWGASETETDLRSQSEDGVDRIRVVHKDKAAYDRVKRPIKLHFCWVAFEEFHILKVSRLCACRCPLRGFSGAVGTNNLPSRPNQVGGQKSYVPTTAPHVKNAHACVDPACCNS